MFHTSSQTAESRQILASRRTHYLLVLAVVCIGCAVTPANRTILASDGESRLGDTPAVHPQTTKKNAEKADGGAKSQEPAKKEASPGKTAEASEAVEEPLVRGPVPLEIGKNYIYRWRKDGKEIATTAVTYLKRPSDNSGQSKTETAPKELMELTGRWQFSQGGRKLFARSSTSLDANLRPESYWHKEQMFAEPDLKGANSIIADFAADGGTKVTLQQPSQPPIVRQLKVSTSFLLFDKNAFEHWVLLAPTLRREPSVKRTLFMPSDFRTFVVDFQYDGETTIRGKEAHRWNVDTKSFKAKLWVAPNGLLLRYTQKNTEILLDEQK